MKTARAILNELRALKGDVPGFVLSVMEKSLLEKVTELAEVVAELERDRLAAGSPTPRASSSQ